MFEDCDVRTSWHNVKVVPYLNVQLLLKKKGPPYQTNYLIKTSPEPESPTGSEPPTDGFTLLEEDC